METIRILNRKEIVFIKVLIIYSTFVFCQQKEIINLSFDQSGYNLYAKNYALKIYNLNLDNKIKLYEKYKIDTSDLVIKYSFKDLNITSIPIFKLDKNEVSSNINVLKIINFENDFAKQNFKIYKDKGLIYSGFIQKQDHLLEFDLITNLLTLNDPKAPFYYGSKFGFLSNIVKEKEYFTFFINCVEFSTCFIIDKGIAYAVFLSGKDNSMIKVEINSFFQKKYLKKNIRSTVKPYTIKLSNL
jgi:hypothetical protein